MGTHHSSAQHKPVPPACLDAELWLGPWAHAPPLSQHTSYSSSSMLARGTDDKLLWETKQYLSPYHSGSWKILLCPELIPVNHSL